MAASRVLALLITAMAAVTPQVIAAQAPAPVAAATPPSSTLTPYRINPGDEIQIFVWGEERLQRSAKILPDGSFSFPLVGRVDAVGKLTSDIEATISKGLQTQYRGDVPQVTVSVVSPAGLQFSIIGKVNSPGTFTPGRYVNVLEALSLAGGPSEFAQLQNITIIRKEGAGLVSIRVRLGDLLKGSPSAQDLNIPQIQGGDTVIVP